MMLTKMQIAVHILKNILIFLSYQINNQDSIENMRSNIQTGIHTTANNIVERAHKKQADRPVDTTQSSRTCVKKKKYT